MIKYHVGDLFEELKKVHSKTVIIPHICNDVGAWGAGFVVPLGIYFPEAHSSYLAFAEEACLGDLDYEYCDLHEYDNQILVCNMVAQQGLISKNNPHPIKYGALAKCLDKVAELCEFHLGKSRKMKPEIHTCAFGSGLAGGNWGIIATLMEEIIPDDVPIHIYSLNSGDSGEIQDIYDMVSKVIEYR